MSDKNFPSRQSFFLGEYKLSLLFIPSLQVLLSACPSVCEIPPRLLKLKWDSGD